MSDDNRDSVRIEVEDRTGRIVLDRHERRNALDRSTIEAVIGGIRTHCSDPRVRCIVLAARGSVFCGGADLKELEEGEARAGIRIYSHVIDAIASSSKPVIARVQGPAAGGGVGLVAACHLAAGTPGARFITPEVRSGLFPLMVHAILEPMIGAKRAFAMDLTGRELSAEEARDLGLLNEVVEEERIDGTIDAWIDSIAGIAPEVLERALRALHQTRGGAWSSRVVVLQNDLNRIADRGRG